MVQAAEVGNKLDQVLSRYESYGGTYWHRDGEIRVRIAKDRLDSATAKQAAASLSATIDTTRVGDVQIEETTVSNQDLLDWARSAQQGELTNVKSDDVLSVAFDRVCQHVIVFVANPADNRLSLSEQSRYYLSKPAIEEDHSRDTDKEPFYGGVRMYFAPVGRDERENITCTGGFTMLRNGHRYLSTAGHCGSDNYWTTRYPEYIGWESVNPFEDDIPAHRHDAMLINGRTYLSPIWFGVWNTQNWRYVTGKFFNPPLVGSRVWVSAGRTDLKGAEVRDQYYPGDSECRGSTVIVRFDPGDVTASGDSGSPWVVPNNYTARSDDVLAAGIHTCSRGEPGGLGMFSAIDNVELWTGSTVVESSP